MWETKIERWVLFIEFLKPWRVDTCPHKAWRRKCHVVLGPSGSSPSYGQCGMQQGWHLAVYERLPGVAHSEPILTSLTYYDWSGILSAARWLRDSHFDISHDTFGVYLSIISYIQSFRPWSHIVPFLIFITCLRNSNFKSLSCIPQKMRWLLKSLFEQNSIVINHKLNSNFKSHIIIRRTSNITRPRNV